MMIRRGVPISGLGGGFRRAHWNGIGLFLIIGLIGILFSACPTGDGDAMDDQKTYTDLSYGPSKSQKLDLFFPDTEGGKLNVILFIHGGAWIGGDKAEFVSSMQKMRDSELIAAAMNYRLLPEGNAGDMLDDVDAVITLIKKKAADKGIAVNKLILVGASAGAHLSLLYSYKKYAASPIPIAFCAGLSSPTDFTDPAYYVDILPAKILLMSALTGTSITAVNYMNEQAVETLKSISPIHYAASGVPPTLLAVGRKDDIVPPSNTDRLKDALDTAGVANQLYEYPNSGHGLDDSTDKDVHDEFYKGVFQYIAAYGN